MYWASHRSNNSMRIYMWNESLTKVESVDRYIPASSPLTRGQGQCAAAFNGGSDWCSVFAANIVLQVLYL